MADSLPLVSAIITTHNRADLLPRAIDSVLVQTYENMEIIVVNDGSVDHTADVIEEYKGQCNIRHIQFDDSVGACRARNKGIEEASGEFVAGLDDDDEWHQDRIQCLMNAYSDKYAFVTSDTRMIHSKGEAVWHKAKIIDLETLQFTNQVGNQVLARRDRILEVGGFDPELEAAQDYDLWLRLCRVYGPIKNVQKPLQNIHMDHQEDRITSHSSSKGYYQFYKKHKKYLTKAQRKYQLYNIRRSQGKSLSISEFISWVPAFRYWAEFKKIFTGKWLGWE
ncbi:glycosyltransferase [Fodinibius saliphilus]|uniref:glycosyltransferase n=1 Tax=Fodinibius saliphilus TaxID=1920650 RepID=UPI0011082A74|nr:glycosyltransferase [Fodinibius saliphilus]